MPIRIVGAGPGDPELITVKGQRYLSQADVVVYAGSLVNPALLKLTKSGAKIYNSATMTLDEVITVMVEGVVQGQEVVRLHTGDPSLYGAIQEQIDALARQGLDVEVVPGVSSFLAAAAALKQEYTLPEVSQTVIITRLEGRTPVPPKEKLALLAAHGATLCIFLSVHMLDKVVQELIAGGYDQSTPVAIVRKASWPDQKILQGTLGSIVAASQGEGMERTAMIIVGPVLAKQYELSRLYAPDFSHMFREKSCE